MVQACCISSNNCPIFWVVITCHFHEANFYNTSNNGTYPLLSFWIKRIMAKGSWPLLTITLGVLNVCYYTTSQLLIAHCVTSELSPTSAYCKQWQVAFKQLSY